MRTSWQPTPTTWPCNIITCLLTDELQGPGSGGSRHKSGILSSFASGEKYLTITRVPNTQEITRAVRDTDSDTVANVLTGQVSCWCLISLLMSLSSSSFTDIVQYSAVSSSCIIPVFCKQGSVCQESKQMRYFWPHINPEAEVTQESAPDRLYFSWVIVTLPWDSSMSAG